VSIEVMKQALTILEARRFLEHQDEIISEAIDVLRKGLDKEWINLTNEEVESIDVLQGHFYETVCTKLKEKNT